MFGVWRLEALFGVWRLFALRASWFFCPLAHCSLSALGFDFLVSSVFDGLTTWSTFYFFRFQQSRMCRVFDISLNLLANWGASLLYLYSCFLSAVRTSGMMGLSLQLQLVYQHSPSSAHLSFWPQPCSVAGEVSTRFAASSLALCDFVSSVCSSHAQTFCVWQFSLFGVLLSIIVFFWWSCFW